MKASSPKDNDYYIWILLNQARDSILRFRENELRPYGISAMEAGALIIIQTIGNKTTPAEISRWIFREHHTVTALLGRMEKKGLITKTKDSGRKNMWRVSLTKKGRSAYRQALKNEAIRVSLSSLSENEHQQLELYLRKVRDQALKHAFRVPVLPFP